MDGDLQRDTLHISAPSPVIEGFTTNSNPLGTAIHVSMNAGTSFGISEMLRLFEQEGVGSNGLTLSQDPMFSELSSTLMDNMNTQTSTGSDIFRSLFPSSQESLPRVSSSQVSLAFANSQQPSQPCTQESWNTFIHHFVQTFPNSTQSGAKEGSFVAHLLQKTVTYPVEQSGNVDFRGDCSAEEVDVGRRESLITPAAVADADNAAGERLSPDVSDVPGEYGFEVRVPDVAGKEWIYVKDEKMMFVKINTFFDAEFFFKKTPPVGTYVKARAVFQTQAKWNKPVNDCKVHPIDAKTGYLYTDFKKAQVNAEKAMVVLTLNPPKTVKNGKKVVNGSWKVPAAFGLRCWNSCYKSKTRICIIFEAVHDSVSLGSAHIKVRCCACPDRDSKMLKESKEPKEAGTKVKNGKRKLEDVVKQEVVEAPLGGPSTVARRVSDVMDVEGVTKKMRTGDVVGVEQKWGKEKDGSLWYELWCRVAPSQKMFLDTFVSMGNLLDVACKNNILCAPSAPLPSSLVSTASQGFRTPLPPKNPLNGTASEANAQEIRTWLRTVCNSNLVSEDVFLLAGVTSLDQIFLLSKENLETILGGELMPEAVEKYWMKITEKERPLPAASQPQSQSQSGSTPARGLASLRKRPK